MVTSSLKNFFTNLSNFFISEKNLRSQLADAISSGELERVKNLAPYLEINKSFPEMKNYFPAFFALTQDQPLIANYLISSYDALLDNDQYSSKEAVSEIFKKSLYLAAKNMLKPIYLNIIKNLTATDVDYIQGRKTELKEPKYIHKISQITKDNLPAECADQINFNLICDDYKIEFKQQETVSYLFKELNSTHNVFIASDNKINKIVILHNDVTLLSIPSIELNEYIKPHNETTLGEFISFNEYQQNFVVLGGLTTSNE